MPDLQEPLLAHLQREARKARERPSIEEDEPQIAASRQTNESRTLRQCLKTVNYEI
jgi:hypothetical protein